jgi:PadR family transcriptional regulator, regulatory protein PadR
VDSSKSASVYVGRTKLCLLLIISACALLWVSHMAPSPNQKIEVLPGTLALMTLKTLESLGALHGYGIARRLEQISGDRFAINYGTLYPTLLKLEQEGYISAEWGVSENNRKAKFYDLTRSGRKQLQKETQGWAETVAIMSRVLTIEGASR